MPDHEPTAEPRNDWQPALYTRFEAERTQPARDLLYRCRFDSPDGAGMRIVDLGCGPGNSTQLLAERFPRASIIGVDTSPAMLEAARRRLPSCRFEAGDIASWRPAEPADLVYSNAALQWVPDHASLLPRLFAAVAHGGLFAAQVPDNLAEPAQTAMREIAAEPDFRDAFAGDDPDADRTPIDSAEAVYDWMVPAAEIDVWHTTYRHPMPSAAAITEWFSSTGLKPFLDRLDAPRRELFEQRYTERMETAYPPRADGTRLLAFPRLFVLARKL